MLHAERTTRIKPEMGLVLARLRLEQNEQQGEQ